MFNQKRKLPNADIRVGQATVKRLRNDAQQQPSAALSAVEPESILLDPDDYVIETSDAQAYRAFDWTLEDPSPCVVLPATLNVSARNTVHTMARPLNQPNAIARTNAVHQQQRKRQIVSEERPTPSSFTRPSVRRGRPSKNSRLSHIYSVRSIDSSDRRKKRRDFSIAIQSSSAASAPSFRSMAATNSHSQASNEQGIFSAFHDSKYYRCNICKFKSASRFVSSLSVRIT